MEAVKRRLKFELGINIENVHETLPDFSYRAEKDGIVENELCPVFVGFTDQEPAINKGEVENVRWISWHDFLNEINEKPGTYSVWCEEESKLLAKNGEFLKLYKEYVR